MSFKTLLVHAQPEHWAEPRLAAAAALASDLGAALSGLGAEMMQPLGYGDAYGLASASWIPLLRERLETNLKDAEAAFRRHAAGLPTEWRTAVDYPAKRLARVARGADLIVAGGVPHDQHDGYRMADTGELMLLAGRPVLSVPPKGGRLIGENVIVAWKDTREARRAVSDALPFLQRAKEVLILAICPSPDAQAAEQQTEDVARALSRHGVSARCGVAVAPEEMVWRELNTEADRMGADLVVMGGYGHSRVNEWLFGGLTRSLLLEPERFVLFSH